MKKLIVILLISISNLCVCQNTYIPDDNFELYLINLGIDNILDDYVSTSSIDTIKNLNLDQNQISNLTGISDFVQLERLYCVDNQITSLDITQNSELYVLFINFNNLTTLNLKNGNNKNMYVQIDNNPNLTCITVDDSIYSTNNWFNIDPQQYFSSGCSTSTTDINESQKIRFLLKKLNLSGQEIKPQTNTPIIEIFDDGSTEKKIIIEK